MPYYPSLRLLYFGGVLSILAVVGHFLPFIFSLVQFGVLIVLTLALTDFLLLHRAGSRVICSRTMARRFSNGDDNEISLELRNGFSLRLLVKVMDQVPVQFQMRGFVLSNWVGPGTTQVEKYHLRPHTRGAYHFGDVILLLSTELCLIERKVMAPGKEEVKVYPSFLGLDQIELKAINSKINNTGIKRIRRIGQSTEFDTIKDYVIGDDPRHINWFNTASSGKLMVNQYVDEKSQNVYCILDKSRIMKSPFEGLTLLDHSINAALALMTVALRKDDNVGLMAFEQQMDTFLKASKGSRQAYYLMESLYRETTTYKEPDFSELILAISRHINQRSLLLLFTNFESASSLERQLPYLKEMSKKHLLIVVYFRNTELDEFARSQAESTREIYDQIIARQMLMEKLSIRKTLTKAGIRSLYTSPRHLSTSIVNRYIEIKASREI